MVTHNSNDNVMDKNSKLRINNKMNDIIDSQVESDTRNGKLFYTLSDEIQRVLIEDFYPPISSSTVPGNPGRLYVTLPGDRNT